jgi:hypothetical protein
MALAAAAARILTVAELCDYLRVNPSAAYGSSRCLRHTPQALGPSALSAIGWQTPGRPAGVASTLRICGSVGVVIARDESLSQRRGDIAHASVKSAVRGHHLGLIASGRYHRG